MLFFIKFIKEQSKKSFKKLKDLYEAVQQAGGLVPKLYLMITIGAIISEEEPKYSQLILIDLMKFLSSVKLHLLVRNKKP